MTTNALGAVQFNFFEGAPPQFVTQHIESLNRPGVNGTQFVTMGRWSDSFELIAVRDSISAGSARNDLGILESMIGSVATLTYESVVLGVVMVLGVAVESMTAAACVLGGVSVPAGNSGVIQRVRIQLRFL